MHNYTPRLQYLPTQRSRTEFVANFVHLKTTDTTLSKEYLEVFGTTKHLQYVYIYRPVEWWSRGGRAYNTHKWNFWWDASQTCRKGFWSVWGAHCLYQSQFPSTPLRRPGSPGNAVVGGQCHRLSHSHWNIKIYFNKWTWKPWKNI